MDTDILEELYRKYYGPAILYCLRLCGDRDLAQDLVADAFVKAYLSLPNKALSFRYWLLRVCRNLWIDHLRKKKWEASDEVLDYISNGTTPEITYLQSEQQRFLWKCISELSPLDRELVTLHYFSEISLQEAAAILGKSYDATRQRMVRLRQILRLKMEEQGYDRKL